MLGGRDGRRLVKRIGTYAEFNSKPSDRDISLRDCVCSMVWIPFVQRDHQSDDLIQKSEHHRRRAIHVVRSCVVPPYTQNVPVVSK